MVRDHTDAPAGRLARRSLPLMLVTLIACGEGATEPTTPQLVQLVVWGDLAGSGIAGVAAEVTAADMEPVRTTLSVRNDSALGPLTVLPGLDRLLTLAATDGQGAESHRGSRTLVVREGLTPAVTVTLTPVGEGTPVTLTVASVRMEWVGGPVMVRVGGTAGLEVRVLSPAGVTVEADVAWSSLTPDIVEVDETGMVTGLRPGEGRVAVTYAGINLEKPLHVWDARAYVTDVIARSFVDWHQAAYAFDGMGLALSAASFQHSVPWANAGMEEFSRIPRAPVENDPQATYYGNLRNPWDRHHQGVRAVVEGLEELAVPETRALLSGEEAARLEAVGRLVQGLSLASLALLYDRANVGDPLGDGPAVLAPYPEVMDSALARLDEVIALAEGRTFTVPSSWLRGEVTAAELVAIAHSLKARFRAGVARTPEERAAVDWAAVVADVDAGVTGSWAPDMALDYAHNWVLDHATSPASSELTYFVDGMADQSMGYQTWLGSPLGDRAPILGDDTILIVTPDTRFPRGATLAEQQASDGTLYATPTTETWGHEIATVWARPDRGTWRWSFYWYRGSWDYLQGADPAWPEIDMAEMRLLKAEGLYRLGDRSGAAALVNVSRTAHGLDATDEAGTNSSCVPRLPDGSCGGLFEMLKWEKRHEVRFAGLFSAPWYFDSRGWGDLYRGTFLQLPVPCSDLQVLGEACYTFGGGSAWSAPRSSYGWPDEG